MRYFVKPSCNVVGLIEELPEGFSDEIVTTSGFLFSWRDRLALLLSGRLTITTYTLCEVKPGNTINRRTGMVVGFVDESGLK